MLSSQLKESQSELETLIKIFAKMPGLGPRSAQRLVFHLIKKREIILDQLISSLENINSKISSKLIGAQSSVSKLSSRVTFLGSKSVRVDSSCPNLIKTGPKRSKHIFNANAGFFFLNTVFKKGLKPGIISLKIPVFLIEKKITKSLYKLIW